MKNCEETKNFQTVSENKKRLSADDYWAVFYFMKTGIIEILFFYKCYLQIEFFLINSFSLQNKL